jgi:hypothetical protein
MVTKILANRFYVQFRPDSDHGITWTKREGIEREGRHVAAWSQEMWKQIRAATERLSHAPKAAPYRRWHFPFAGMMICWECGLFMQCQPTTKGTYVQRYYTCRRAHHDVLHSKPYGIQAEVIEDAFGAILATLNQPGWRATLEALLDSQEPETTADVFAEQRAALEAAIQRENVKLDAGGIDEAEYKRHVARLRSQLRNLPTPHPSGRPRTTVASGGAHCGARTVLGGCAIGGATRNDDAPLAHAGCCLRPALAQYRCIVSPRGLRPGVAISPQLDLAGQVALVPHLS